MAFIAKAKIDGVVVCQSHYHDNLKEAVIETVDLFRNSNVTEYLEPLIIEVVRHRFAQPAVRPKALALT